MSKRRAVALLAVVAVASAAGGYAVNRWWLSRDAAGQAPGIPEAVAKALFATRLADLKGGAQTLEPWRGRVLVVNFWATWCAPCREEIPVFVRMQERYGAQGLQFVGIAIDQPDKVADFAREFQINYPVLLGGLETLELVRLVGNRARGPSLYAGDRPSPQHRQPQAGWPQGGASLQHYSPATLS